MKNLFLALLMFQIASCSSFKKNNLAYRTPSNAMKEIYLKHPNTYFDDGVDINHFVTKLGSLIRVTKDLLRPSIYTFHIESISGKKTKLELSGLNNYLDKHQDLTELLTERKIFINAKGASDFKRIRYIHVNSIDTDIDGLLNAFKKVKTYEVKPNNLRLVYGHLHYDVKDSESDNKLKITDLGTIKKITHNTIGLKSQRSYVSVYSSRPYVAKTYEWKVFNDNMTKPDMTEEETIVESKCSYRVKVSRADEFVKYVQDKISNGSTFLFCHNLPFTSSARLEKTELIPLKLAKDKYEKSKRP